MATASRSTVERELRALLGESGVLPGDTRDYLHDATESRGVSGRADAVALPADAAEVSAIVAWCCDHDVPIVPRGGGTGFTGGAVPDGGVVLERLAEAIAATREIGERHRLPACSWGHAGDGNLHSTFMVDLADPAELQRSHDAAAELFELAARLGGAVSGEHGIGLLKRGALARQWAEPALALHDSIKRLLDPKGLLNPGKKLAR